MKKFFLLQILLLFVFFCHVINGKNTDTIKNSPKDKNIPSEQYKNPLTGLQSFSMLMVYFSEENETVEKINKIIMEELGALGTIKVITSEKGSLQNAFWEGYDGQAFFEFDSQDITSFENKKIPATRYTLNVHTAATINKTKANTVVEAWRKDCYVKNESNNDLSNKSVEAYRSLIREFKESYLLYNPEKKPIFYLFTSVPKYNAA